jgi:DNA mismatch endonuclease, patch repair protein
MDRSENMRRIRSKHTGPELALRRALHRCGLRYRLHCRDLPGAPDIVFRSARLAIFVHGCFWHQHAGCRYAARPKSRHDYWEPKFERNIERDRKVEEHLMLAGYRVLVIWECQLARHGGAVTIASEILHLLRSTQ